MKILGTGSALPKKVVTNDDLAAFLDTNDEWISTRTGIRQRRVLTDETLQSLAEQAGKNALENAGVAPEEIDFVLVTTVQAETLSPALACDIQPALGLRCMGMDLNGGCTGFIAALAVAEGLIASRRAKKLLIVSAEALSRFADWTDRSTCVLFGDAAGAAVVGEGEGIEDIRFESEPRREVLYADTPPGNSPFAIDPRPACYLKMRRGFLRAAPGQHAHPGGRARPPEGGRGALPPQHRAHGQHVLGHRTGAAGRVEPRRKAETGLPRDPERLWRGIVHGYGAGHLVIASAALT